MTYQDEILAQMKAQTEQMKAQTALLATVSKQLERLEWLVAPQGPNYTHPLVAFTGFDWTKIGATITGRDAQGPTRVEWFGRVFTRRSAGGKFGKAIWFSRYTGETESGQKTYARLVTFKDYSEAEPVPDQVAQSAGPQSAGQHAGQNGRK